MRSPKRRLRLVAASLAMAAAALGSQSDDDDVVGRDAGVLEVHRETPTLRRGRALSREAILVPAQAWDRDGHRSVQVNVSYVDGVPHNVLGDAANEPSICVDPTDPSRLSIGWRQFDSIESDFRQSGWATSHDGGSTWPHSGTLTPGVFGSDPVLASDPVGNFFYASINGDHLRMFRSFDSGVTWLGPSTVVPGFHDKEWMAIDPTGGNIYLIWTDARNFTRSTDGGRTFLPPVGMPLNDLLVSTIALDVDGAVYVIDVDHDVARSTDAWNAQRTPTFERVGRANLGGVFTAGAGPNPAGLLGQTYLASDHSTAPTRGNLYALGSVRPFDGRDPLDVMFARSSDGARTWTPPIRVNDDPRGNAAWQWFGAMSVAPNGRIDVIWNDTRSQGRPNVSELYYAWSEDGGDTWAENVPVSPPFDSWLGWPHQDRLGDYYHIVSDDGGVNVAYAATFNGEQDVFFLRIEIAADTAPGRG